MERYDDIEVKSYDFLAYCYDELLGDRDAFSLWLEYIEEQPFHSVLELASGSGVMAGILLEKGYDVLASDISASMKDVAKKNYSGRYEIIDMSDYELGHCFDLVLCICDSANYLEEEELDSFFECAYKHLNTGGRMIFDMHSSKRLSEFSEEYIEEGHLNDMPYQWTILADPYDKTIHEHFTFYTERGMIQEYHTQHVFEVQMMKSKMEKAGFSVRVIEDFVPDEKILVIGEKL